MITHPVDTMKIRMQVQGELQKAGQGKQHRSVFHGFYNVYNLEGAKGLYKGLSASIAREVVYSTICLGLYEPYKKFLGASDPHSTPLYVQVLAGALAGMTGAAPASPTDLVKVRMQADTGTP